MAGSTCIAARRAILDLVASDGRIADARVSYDPPPAIQAGERTVYGVGFQGVDVEDPTLKAGRRRRAEAYDVMIVCSAVAAGASQEQADEAACDLLAVLDEQVADDPTLSGADLTAGQQILSARLVGWETTDGPVGKTGHGSAFLARVRVQARLL